jgi:predicted nucleic-acid-binding protein
LIGLDSNVVVRYLAQDDPVQSPRATRLLERELTVAQPGFVSVVTMAETAWVLERSYGLSDLQIARAFEAMLQSDSLVIECEQEVFAATTVIEERRGSFADALIAELGLKAGCTHTFTFDRRASRLLGFALLK